jgi:predicted DNA-binding protein (UPF0251 family)
MNKPLTRSSLLGHEIDKRLAQLGLSRREFARRANIGRQTLHEIIHNPDKRIADATFVALDNGLKWQAGVSRAFHQGVSNARELVGAMSTEQKINDYLIQILQRLAQMDIDALEREVIILEEESGETRDSETSQLIESQVRKLVDSLMQNPHGGNPNRNTDAI